VSAVERLPSGGTWQHESYREYAEHSLTHYDVPDDEIERAVAAIEGIRRTVARIEDGNGDRPEP
jgi:hypothetical protein